MKVTILYRKDRDYNRTLEEYVREFKSRTGQDLEMVDVDSREGSAKAELYDAVQYPAIIAENYQGEMMRMWQGMPLPLMNELSFYNQQN